MKEKTGNSALYILLLVGTISAFGPFVTDFYLPALPALSTYFDTSASMVALTLTVSMVGLAIGQLFIGPLSDRYGRKLPLLASLILFILSTLACQSVTMSNNPPKTGAQIGAKPCTQLSMEKKCARRFPSYKSVAMDLEMTTPPAPATPCINRKIRNS